MRMLADIGPPVPAARALLVPARRGDDRFGTDIRSFDQRRLRADQHEAQIVFETSQKLVLRATGADLDFGLQR